ncbi:uncharacterized protein TNCV_383951 [Trichonephila clavipes]|nr:uncharacterized protein TNCV_383951 [Trichonephila clavipes]
MDQEHLKNSLHKTCLPGNYAFHTLGRLMRIFQPPNSYITTFNALYEKSLGYIPTSLTLNGLGQRKQVCLQWIPSHIGVHGNEAADELAGRGWDLPNPSSTVLTHSKIHSFKKNNKMNLTWRNPPAHHWHAAKSPGLSLHCRKFRAHQTTLARFRSGHLRCITFVLGEKSFYTCPCSLLASPAHLLDCWGISLRQLYEEQDLVCHTITRKGQMDLV